MTEALWSAQEIRIQAEQVAGQLDVWECIAQVCTCAEPLPECAVSPCPVHGGQ